MPFQLQTQAQSEASMVHFTGGGGASGRLHDHRRRRTRRSWVCDEAVGMRGVNCGGSPMDACPCRRCAATDRRRAETAPFLAEERPMAAAPPQHQHAPSTMKPMPMTSGGPTPNHESPDSEFSGLERSMIDFTSTHVRITPPSAGATTANSMPLSDLQPLAAVVERAGEAGEAVVEGDHQAERGDRVEEHVLADERQPDVPDDRHDAHTGSSRSAASGSARGRRRTLRQRARRAPSTAIVRAVGRIVVCVEAEAEVSTAMIRSLPNVAAEHRVAEDRRARRPGRRAAFVPANATARRPRRAGRSRRA